MRGRGHKRASSFLRMGVRGGVGWGGGFQGVGTEGDAVGSGTRKTFPDGDRSQSGESERDRADFHPAKLQIQTATLKADLCIIGVRKHVHSSNALLLLLILTPVSVFVSS